MGGSGFMSADGASEPSHLHDHLNIMTMKLRSPFGWLALAALSASPLCGQENLLPVSRTAGVLTTDLPAGKSTLLGMPFASIVASGTVSAVNASQLTLASSPAVLPTFSTPHAIKITSRVDQRGTGSNAPAGVSTNAYGRSAKITAQNNQVVTAPLAVVPNVGDEFVIYKLATLSSLFGANNSANLKEGESSATADIVYLASAGELVGYFYHSTADVWRAAATPTAGDAGATEISPGAAILVARKADGAANIEITFTGDTLPGRQTFDANTGFQVINNPYTVSTTLAASGLQTFVTGGTGAASADVIYLEQDGVLSGYYYKSGGLGGIGWRAISNNAADAGATLVSPGKAILFKEQAGSVGFALQEPFAE